MPEPIDWIVPVPDTDRTMQFISAINWLIDARMGDVPADEVYHALKFLAQLHEGRAFPAIEVTQGEV